MINRVFFSSVSECTFGKQIRELGSVWFADLGPPFGIMYCIKCECIPVCNTVSSRFICMKSMYICVCVCIRMCMRNSLYTQFTY